MFAARAMVSEVDHSKDSIQIEFVTGDSWVLNNYRSPLNYNSIQEGFENTSFEGARSLVSTDQTRIPYYSLMLTIFSTNPNNKNA